MNTLIDALFENWSPQYQKKLFIHTHDDKQISRAQFVAQINQIGNALIKLGVKSSDRVAAQVEKSPQAFALYFAVVKIGGIFLPLNTGYTIAELTYFINDAEPALIITEPSISDALKSAVAKRNIQYSSLDAHGSGALMDLAQKQPSQLESTPRTPQDLAAILYTSGTTGRSKGAMLSHKNLLSNALILRDYWHFTEQDVLLHALPIYHTHGLFVAGNIITLVGGAMIYLPKFDPEKTIAMLHKATAMMGVPTFYTRLLQEARFDKNLAQHMRLFISGSAPLLAETHIEFEERTGHKILERYGMTETSMNTSNPYHGERRPGTVGFPLPEVALRIVDQDTGAEKSRGEIGSIEVKGDNVTSGYWQNEQKTTESFRDDGFFITGDMGMIDDEGYVTIVGRDKDLIISGGLNIYPKEVEDVINAIQGVNESAVIGVRHPDFGEAVVAIVALSTTEQGKTLTKDAIMQILAEQIAKFKQPKIIDFVDALPRNTMGKVQKAEIRKTYADLFKK